MVTTALNIIEGAGRLIGIIRKGEAMSADEGADGLVALNDMLASWSNNSLLVYNRVSESFSLVSGTASYLIGAGQTFSTVKPIKIISAFIRDGNTDYPLVVLSDDEYQNVSDKTSQSDIPDYLTYNNAHPYGTITLYPKPGAANTIHLLSEKVLTALASLSTTVDLPAGWNRALKYNLAVAIAPEYGAQLDPLVLRAAKESKDEIKNAINRNRSMAYKPSGVQKTNIYNGGFT